MPNSGLPGSTPAESLVFGHPGFAIPSGYESGTPIIIPPNYGGEGGVINGGARFNGKVAPLPRGIPQDGPQPPNVPKPQLPAYNILMPFPPRAIVLSQKQLPQVGPGQKPVQFNPAGTASVNSKVAAGGY